jgi:hypothetical protein
MKFAIWFLGTLSALIILHSCEGVSNARTAPTYKMYCEVENKVSYWGRFDSGQDDDKVCTVTSKMWTAFLNSQGYPAKCWCSTEVQA